MAKLATLSKTLMDVIEERKSKEKSGETIWLYTIRNGRWVFAGTALKSNEERYIERNFLVSYYKLPLLSTYPSLINGREPKPTKVY